MNKALFKVVKQIALVNIDVFN